MLSVVVDEVLVVEVLDKLNQLEVNRDYQQTDVAARDYVYMPDLVLLVDIKEHVHKEWNHIEEQE